MELADCSNCGTARSDTFCSHCGQNSRDYQRALPPMLWELLRETFDVDSRILNTFILLLTKPGQLAVEFSRNRRASYISPIRLYLFVSVSFFFILSTTSSLEVELQAGDETISTETVEENVAVDLNKFLDTDRQKKVKRMLDGEESVAQQLAIVSIAQGVTDRSEPLTEFQGFIAGQLIDAIYEPTRAVSTLLDNLPIAMFLLLPVFALILQLIYAGKHKYYVEHLVFAMQLHTFAFLVYGLMLARPEFNTNATLASLSGWIGSLLWLVLLIYHFKSLRRYYGEGFGRTSFKYIVQMAIYFLLLIPTSTIAILLFTLTTV